MDISDKWPHREKRRFAKMYVACLQLYEHLFPQESDKLVSYQNEKLKTYKLSDMNKDYTAIVGLPFMVVVMDVPVSDLYVVTNTDSTVLSVNKSTENVFSLSTNPPMGPYTDFVPLEDYWRQNGCMYTIMRCKSLQKVLPVNPYRIVNMYTEWSRFVPYLEDERFQEILMCDSFEIGVCDRELRHLALAYGRKSIFWYSSTSRRASEGLTMMMSRLISLAFGTKEELPCVKMHFGKHKIKFVRHGFDLYTLQSRLFINENA